MSMGLKGSLAELSLADLIEMTSLGGKSGRLTLFDADGVARGELAFHDGRLVGAACGELRAEKAFYALLALGDGAFEFDPAVVVDDESRNLPTQSLLMEGMRRLDELGRLRHQVPASARLRLLGGEVADQLEARVLGYLGPGARLAGDVVDGLLVGGHADEYDALRTIEGLAARGVVRVEAPRVADDEERGAPGRAPQPELER
jgi:hypothetical protein